MFRMKLYGASSKTLRKHNVPSLSSLLYVFLHTQARVYQLPLHLYSLGLFQDQHGIRSR